MTLSPAEVDQFSRDGCLIRSEVFGANELALMRNEASEILNLLVNSSLANKRTSGRLDVRELPDRSHVVRKVQPVVDLSLLFTSIARDERLFGPVSQLMTGEPELMEEKLIYKQRLLRPITGIDVLAAEDRFLIHSDWAYHRAQQYPPTIINAAVCVDDCPPLSGPLHVWPGTHREFIEHEPMGTSYRVRAEWLDGLKGVDLITSAGSVIFFHGLLIHCSQPNRSPSPRRVVIFSYHSRGDGIAFDARNGRIRLEEAPYEWHYVRLKMSGHFSDAFCAEPKGDPP
jgi:hypothetical protein